MGRRMQVVIFYTKPDCPLCDEVRQILETSDTDWREVNILSEPNLWRQYRHEIPVIQSGNQTWFYRNHATVPLSDWLHDQA